MAKIIRLATAEDTEEIRAIYAHYIDQSVTFECILPTVEQFQERIENILRIYPYLVAEKEEKIIDYTYTHRFRDRQAYDWSVECSIYLHPLARGMGLGKILYSALMKLLALQNIQMAYACVTMPNIPSEALHQSVGFRAVAQMPNAGYKAGAWRDVKWYAKEIGDFPLEPKAVVPLKETEQRLQQQILQEAVEQWEKKIALKKSI